MGLTAEEKNLRANSKKIREIKEKYLRTCKDKEDYVFISYKSDDWKRVFEDIVYGLCTNYGLKVYFDADFDDNNELWLEQFKENMKNDHCKAVISFLSNEYRKSYATLMELLYSGTEEGASDFSGGSRMPIIPISLEYVKNEIYKDMTNTGLGTKEFKGGITSDHWENELKEFNSIFKNYTFNNTGTKIDKKYTKYDDPIKGYSEEDGKSIDIWLEKARCASLIQTIIAENKANEIQSDGMNLENILVSVKNKLGERMKSVFDESLIVKNTETKLNKEQLSANENNTGSNEESSEKLQSNGNLEKNYSSGTEQSIPKESYQKNQEFESQSKYLSVNSDTSIPIERVEILDEKSLISQTGYEEWYFDVSGSSADILFNERDRSCIVKAGARLALESPNFRNYCGGAYHLKKSLTEKGFIRNDVFVRDFPYKSMATVACLLSGNNVSLNKLIQDKKHFIKKSEKKETYNGSFERGSSKNIAPFYNTEAKALNTAFNNTVSANPNPVFPQQFTAFETSDIQNEVSNKERYARFFNETFDGNNVAEAYTWLIERLVMKEPNILNVFSNYMTFDPRIMSQYRSSKEFVFHGRTIYVDTHSSTNQKALNIKRIVKSLGLTEKEVEFNYASKKGTRNTINNLNFQPFSSLPDDEEDNNSFFNESDAFGFNSSSNTGEISSNEVQFEKNFYGNEEKKEEDLQEEFWRDSENQEEDQGNYEQDTLSNEEENDFWSKSEEEETVEDSTNKKYVRYLEDRFETNNATEAYVWLIEQMVNNNPKLVKFNHKLITLDSNIAKDYRTPKEVFIHGRTVFIEAHSSTDYKSRSIQKMMKYLGLSDSALEFNYSTKYGTRNVFGGGSKKGLDELW